MKTRVSAAWRRIALAAAALLCFTAAAAGQVESPNYVTAAPVANLYSSPSRDSDVVSQAIYGTMVTLLEQQGPWSRVRTPDQYSGWVGNFNLQPRENGAYGQTGDVVQVRSLFASLYREKSVTTHQPVLTVPFETRLEVVAKPTDEDERWYEVRLVSGDSAFIQAGDVAPPGPPLSIPQTLELAKRFLGLPYLWGGTSTFGYDCSGFMQMLIRQRGILMPRDADLQAAWSGLVSVDRKRVQPGDLLYFGAAPEKITHTGMYLGNGQFIHATTHDRPVIQIGKLDDAPWTRLLVGIRRPKP